MNQELRIIILIIVAFGIGSVVLIANPDYRISNNIQSNLDYYPGIEPSSTISSSAAEDTVPSESVINDEETLRFMEEIPSSDFEF